MIKGRSSVFISDLFIFLVIFLFLQGSVAVHDVNRFDDAQFIRFSLVPVQFNGFSSVPILESWRHLEQDGQEIS